MKKTFLGLTLAVTMPLAALAQQVPALETNNIQSTYMPTGFVSAAAKAYGTLPVLSEDRVKLNAKEQKAVNLSNQWKNKAEMPVMGEDGSVKFSYGSTLPSVVCAPLYACDVALQPGEIVTQVDVGDAPRWKVTPATSGSGENATTHLVIKPADAGLITNMLIHTDRRTYNMRLVSKKDSWMPVVGFTYPDEAQAEWAAYKKQHRLGETTVEGSVYSKSSTVAHSDLDFNYRVQGDAPHWKPIRVYSDHNKTYIQFPPSAKSSEIPALVILGQGNQEQLVNYRMVDDRFVVDKIIDKAALITGVGRHQQRVDIIREGT